MWDPDQRNPNEIVALLWMADAPEFRSLARERSMIGGNKAENVRTIWTVTYVKDGKHGETEGKHTDPWSAVLEAREACKTGTKLPPGTAPGPACHRCRHVLSPDYNYHVLALMTTCHECWEEIHGMEVSGEREGGQGGAEALGRERRGEGGDPPSGGTVG